MSPTAKVVVASLDVNVSERVPSEDVSPSLTSAAVIVIVGAVASTAAIAVEELVLPALSVTVMEPVSPSDSGLAFFRRLKIIEFKKSFSKEQMDKKLPSKLKLEASGILNWCIEGYRKYCEEGLEDTNSIRGSVQGFIQRNNPLVEYFETQIKVTNKQADYITLHSLRESVDNFSNELFGKEVTPAQITKFFRTKGLHPKQKREGLNRIRCYQGIKFVEEEQFEIY